MRRLLFKVVLVMALFLPLSLEAASIHFDTTLLGQVRENNALQREVPINEYLGLGLDAPSVGFAGESNMRFFRDFARKINDYDLYQTVLHFKPVEMLQIDFGRQFINEGFSANVADALKIKVMPPKYIDITLFSGIPRNVETGDFNKNDGLRSGLSLNLKGVRRTSAGLHATWQRNNIRRTEWKRSDSILIGADASHQFAVVTTPMIYGLLEYDATSKVTNVGTAGFDIYPKKWLQLNAEFNVFNVNRNTTLPTILGLFTQGRALQGRLATTWTLIPERLRFVEMYAYQRNTVQGGVSRNGHILDISFQIDFDDIGLHVEPGFAYAKSFGGTEHDGRILIHEQFTDELYASVSFDFSSYKKITNNNGKAYSTILWSGYEVIKGLILSGGFEYDRNAFLAKDIRGSFKISYAFDQNI